MVTILRTCSARDPERRALVRASPCCLHTAPPERLFNPPCTAQFAAHAARRSPRRFCCVDSHVITLYTHRVPIYRTKDPHTCLATKPDFRDVEAADSKRSRFPDAASSYGSSHFLDRDHRDLHRSTCAAARDRSIPWTPCRQPIAGTAWALCVALPIRMICSLRRRTLRSEMIRDDGTPSVEDSATAH